MESQYKGCSVNRGIESGTREKELGVANKRKIIRGFDLFLRVAAVVLSLSAAVVLGADRQNTTVAVMLVPTLPAVNVPVTAKWHYSSAFVYFMVANAIACAYGAISVLVITLANREEKPRVATMILVFDLMMVVLLFSSFGASLAVGLISYRGNSHAHWRKVCNVIGKFCHQGSAALGLSAVASLVFFLLVLSKILNLATRENIWLA
ncbi:hypothetical protein DH2020_043308 [Rehmannia glutinosa]|uniref:CASP-like protein n=1 Tax=Rehmannia glutinosa TaxID=99300 RepID=A0ABR0UK00_REHGL